MLQRIGSIKPRVFGVDLTQGFYQIPFHRDCWAATAFRGIYEWTRVPMGLFPSEFVQMSTSAHIFNGLCIEHAKYI